MKQYVLKTTGMAALAFFLCSNGFAQELPAPPASADGVAKVNNEQEIVIRKKNDKDFKITVEMKDGKMFINGKPADEYDNNDVVVEKKAIRNMDDDAFSLAAPGESPGIAISPFRRGLSYNDNLPVRSNLAFLGVVSEGTDGKGAKITQVANESSAGKAGLKEDDVITMVNDTKIGGPADLTKAIGAFKPGDKVTVTFMRDGKEQKATATLGKRNVMDFEHAYNFRMPDMDLKSLSNLYRLYTPRDYDDFFRNSDRPKLGIKAQDTEDGKGAKVLGVDEGSPAYKAGIREGDIITQFDGKAVNSADGLANIARESRSKTSFKINFSREGKSKEVEVKVLKNLKTADL
ncbi:MAG: PDZ domain-containing protein [Bacteroidetes bacterium]|nr:PDZ domain-containing protein [Bacteroidota bacterium]MBS1973001.1 PDZ domain-containing protein [Bacteroidota bacterium]